MEKWPESHPAEIIGMWPVHNASKEPASRKPSNQDKGDLHGRVSRDAGISQHFSKSTTSQFRPG